MKHPPVTYYDLDDGTRIGVLDIRVDQDEPLPALDGGKAQKKIRTRAELGVAIDVALMYEAAKEFAGCFDIPGDFLDQLPATLTTEVLRLLSTLANIRATADSMWLPMSFSLGPLYFNAADPMSGAVTDDQVAQIEARVARRVDVQSSIIVDLKSRRR